MADSKSTTEHPDGNTHFVPPKYNDSVRTILTTLMTQRNGLALIAQITPPGDAKRALDDAAHFIDQAVGCLTPVL